MIPSSSCPTWLPDDTQANLPQITMAKPLLHRGCLPGQLRLQQTQEKSTIMKIQRLTLARAVALSAILGHYSEKQLLALRSLLLIPVILLAWMSPAPADTFENFVIQNSSNPSVPGGALDGGGTYSGSFSLDESLIPSNPDAYFYLQTFDVSLMLPFYNLPFDISSANGSVGIFSTFTLRIPETAEDLAIDTIEFGAPDSAQVVLQLVEPAGVFQGGLVIKAEAYYAFYNNDYPIDGVPGSALVIDPAVVPVSGVPQPATLSLLGLGMGLLCLNRIRRRNTVTAA